MIWGRAEAVMLALGSSCKYRSSLAERLNCTETTVNPLLADSYQNPISEWQVTIELYLVASYKAILPLPISWKNYLPWNQSLVPKRLGTTEVEEEYFFKMNLLLLRSKELGVSPSWRLWTSHEPESLPTGHPEEHWLSALQKSGKSYRELLRVGPVWMCSNRLIFHWEKSDFSSTGIEVKYFCLF